MSSISKWMAPRDEIKDERKRGEGGGGGGGGGKRK